MNGLNTIISNNQRAAEIIPGFSGVGVGRSSVGQHKGGADNVRQPVASGGRTVYTNPRTGARVAIRD